MWCCHDEIDESYTKASFLYRSTVGFATPSAGCKQQGSSWYLQLDQQANLLVLQDYRCNDGGVVVVDL
jgi:hypothetical protein